MYDPGMDTEKKKELWVRLENEPERAYRAFESYRSLPRGERTLIEAYRQHVGNPHAAKPQTRGADGLASSPGAKGVCFVVLDFGMTLHVQTS
jgi:hypothetical protein